MGRRKTNLAKCFVISPNDSIFVALRRRAAVSSGASPLDHRCPPRDHRGVAQLVAHLVWDQRVACSSHVTPTFFIRGIPSPETPSAFPPFRIFSFVENTRPGRSPDGDVVASLLYLPSIHRPLFQSGRRFVSLRSTKLFYPRCFAAAPRGMSSPLRFAGCLPVVASLLPHGTRLKAPRPSGPRTEFLRRADALCPVHVEPLWCTNGPSNRISYTKSPSGVQTARQPATKWGVFVAGRCLKCLSATLKAENVAGTGRLAVHQRLGRHSPNYEDRRATEDRTMSVVESASWVTESFLFSM